MKTSTRNRVIVIGLAVLLVVVIVLFTIFDRPKPAEETSPTPSGSASNTLDISAPIEAPASPSGLEPEAAPAVEMGRTASVQMAELFAERYGSYSNQGSYQNLRDLLPVMTPSYRAKTESFLASVDTSMPAASYEGYTATKVATKEIAFNENAGTATYEVSLQQVKTVSGQEPETLYPVLRLSLREIGDDWRIDDAEWVR